MSGFLLKPPIYFVIVQAFPNCLPIRQALHEEPWSEVHSRSNVVVRMPSAKLSKPCAPAISAAETPKMKGQSLKGRNATLKPVNKETIANTINGPMATAQTTDETVASGSTAVTAATNTDVERSVTPSEIHSIKLSLFVRNDMWSEMRHWSSMGNQRKR